MGGSPVSGILFPKEAHELLSILFHLYISTLRLLYIQRLQHVLQKLPPGPALTRLLQLDGALRNAVAQDLHLVRGN